MAVGRMLSAQRWDPLQTHGGEGHRAFWVPQSVCGVSSELRPLSSRQVLPTHHSWATFCHKQLDEGHQGLEGVSKSPTQNRAMWGSCVGSWCPLEGMGIVLGAPPATLPWGAAPHSVHVHTHLDHLVTGGPGKPAPGTH